MAKSIRSKRKRKFRAVKRERYGKKELERLKKTLGVDACKQETDVSMNDLDNLVTVVSAEEIRTKRKEPSGPVETELMDTDGKKRMFNSKTMRDQNGSFPIWMNQRHIRKHKGKVQKKKKQRLNRKK